MQQYQEIKSKFKDAILLFRVGDFYETFYEDAVKCSKTLNIVLAKRSHGAVNVDLAGFPYHVLDNYLPKLIKAGFRVAICDQLEDKKTNNIIKRGVTSLITPGVILNDQVLNSSKNNFLAALHFQKEMIGLALLDISTGEFFMAEGNAISIKKLIENFLPSEIIYQKQKYAQLENFIGTKYFTYPLEDWVFQYLTSYEKLTRHFKTTSLKGFGVEHMKIAIVAAGASLNYIENLFFEKIKHISTIKRIDQEHYMFLDDFTMRNLEILSSNHHSGLSLLNVLDKTLTPMGGRLLKIWLSLPLKELNTIKERHEVVYALLSAQNLNEKITIMLRNMPDISRIISKSATEKINPRELMSLCQALKKINIIKNILLKSNNFILKSFQEKIPNYDILYEFLKNSLNEDPPHQINKGNIIAKGFSNILDDLRGKVLSKTEYLNNICNIEKTRTGIKSLKISYNNILGYYIEVRKTHKESIPKKWIRKQTLINAERYVTEELKEFEEKIKSFEEKIFSLELELFKSIILKVNENIKLLQKGSKIISYIDVLLSFAQNARENNYNQPTLEEGLSLSIIQGRHPMIEIDKHYVPNDILLDPNKSQIMIITGPNMSGKSAILRQTALIVIMAQVGSYVPATAAKLGLVDKIFSRVGASDNITLGESTFMVEMTETATILNNLSARSLIILDEIGRGTGTNDGISIAWAVSEYLHEHPYKPKTIFATHYYELTKISSFFERINNYNISLNEINGTIIFMYKLLPGSTNNSFGLHVAKMAGIPICIIIRAKILLKKFDMLKQQLVENINLIQKIELNTVTPLKALQKLYEIKKIISKIFFK